MPDLLENTQSISIDGDSRSARWKSLRGHLKQLVQVVDENNDRIAALKEEVSQIRERNLKLAEAIQILSDLANEEVQREISLTLNDTDYDIVMDTPAAAPVITANPSPEITEKADTYTVDEFMEMLKGAPGMGAKTLQKVSAYLSQSSGHASQPSLGFDIEGGEIDG